MNAEQQPGAWAHRAVWRFVHRPMSRVCSGINEQVEDQHRSTGKRSYSHSAIVSGNATYWDL